MIVLGLYDKANSMYDKYFMIRDDERNNFIKSLKIIVNNGTDVLSVYSDDFVNTHVIYADGDRKELFFSALNN